MFHIVNELPFVFQILIMINSIPIRIIFPTILDLTPIFMPVLLEDCDTILRGTRVAELQCVDVFDNAQ